MKIIIMLLLTSTLILAQDNYSDNVNLKVKEIIEKLKSNKTEAIVEGVVIAWKEEKENDTLDGLDKVMYAEINAISGSIVRLDAIKDENGLYEHTKSAPLVLWKKHNYSSNPNHGNFILFWTYRPYNAYSSDSNWRIRYAFSFSNHANFINGYNFDLKLNNNIYLQSYWNPMSGHCK